MLNALVVNVWAGSGRSRARPTGPSGDSYVERDRHFLGRIAGTVITGLIFQIRVDRVVPSGCLGLGQDHGPHNELAGVHAELVIWIKGEAHQLTRGILNLGDHQIFGRRKQELRADQLRRDRLMRVNVETGLDVDGEMDGYGLAQWHRQIANWIDGHPLLGAYRRGKNQRESE